MPRCASLQEWEARRTRLVQQILSAAGLLPMPDREPLRVQVFGRLERGDHTVEKVLLETTPGFYLGGNLYRPLARPGLAPGIAKPHGHWPYGRLEHTAIASGQRFNVNLARQGCVVFAYDMLGYNDTIQTPHEWEERLYQLWSFSPLGFQLWNSIRAVDFLSSLPEVDSGRIGAAGESGGGTQTILLAAVDPRVRVAAPVNMVSASMQGTCGCENAPGLRVATSNVEIAALAAPRPLLLVSSTGDWTRNVPHDEYPAIRRIYELYKQPDNVESAQVDAPHNFNRESREAVYRFFQRHLLEKADAGAATEIEVWGEGLQDLLALHGRQLPDQAATFDSLFERWKERSRRSIAQVGDLEALRRVLAQALMVEWPVNVDDWMEDERLVLRRSGFGDRVSGLMTDGTGPPALVVHPDGAQAALRDPRVVQLLGARRPVLAIDAFQTGTAVTARDRSSRFFLTFNLSDDACRVQDILTALCWLRNQHGEAIDLVAFGTAGVWALFAAALARAKVRLHTDFNGFAGTDQDFLKEFFVPGIQRAGGIAAANRLLSDTNGE